MVPKISNRECPKVLFLWFGDAICPKSVFYFAVNDFSMVFLRDDSARYGKHQVATVVAMTCSSAHADNKLDQNMSSVRKSS
jgi:hypothetical protein